MHIATVVDRIGGEGPTQEDPAGVLVCCPVHGDRHPSLLISVTDEHKAIMHCRSHGCSTEAIVTKAGLSWPDLFNVAGEATVDTATPEAELPTTALAGLAAYLDQVQAAFPQSPAAEYAYARFGVDEATGIALGLGYDDGTTECPYLSGSYQQYPRLVVPFADAEGIARAAQGRDLTGESTHRWAGLTNPDGARWAVLGWFNPSADGPVVVTEGPGDGLTAAAAGYTAAFLRGASAARRRDVAAAIHAAGREVILAGDGDAAGGEFTRQLAAGLRDQGTTPRVLRLPDGIADLADWYAADPAAFPGALAEAVSAAPIAETSSSPEPSLAVSFMGDPVELLERVHGFLRRFLSLGNPAWYDVITLWIATTYLVRASESADVAPRLGFLSTVPGSGKTLALDLVCRLCRGHLIIDPTAASVLRAIGAMSYEEDDPEKPRTPVPLGIDEADNLYAARGQDTSSITAILNSGYKRGNTVVRAHSDNQKKAISYETFSPVVWAGLARMKLPDALLSRTFLVEMEQALPHERPESYRPRRHGPVIDDLATQLAAWVSSVADDDVISDHLDSIEGELAEQVANRDLELWSMLTLPAVLAGGDWPERARRACRELRHAGGDQAETLSVRFLRATRDVYRSGRWGKGINNKVVFRHTLAERVMDTDQIFQRWSAGNGIDDEHVREFLREFQVLPKSVRVAKETGRGFRWADLQPKWDRYLADDDEEPITE